MLKGHGGDIYAVSKRTGIPAEELLDFSSNISPLPLPAGLEAMLCRHITEIRNLPEVDSMALRQLLASRFDLSPGQFLVSGGTTHWIYSLPLILEPSSVIIPCPTYADYEDGARCGKREVKCINFWMEEPGPGQFPQKLISASRPGSMIFLCNPNNPTGGFINPSDLLEAISATPELFWVVDESYAPFAGPDCESSLLVRKLPGNCLVLRSFSKIFGIPGLRLGYAAGAEETMRGIASHMRPWQVNRLAQKAGEFLLSGTGYEKEVRQYCGTEKGHFLQMTSGIQGLEYLPGKTHFMLFRLCGSSHASDIAASLEQSGILVRDCSNFRGLEEGKFIRISIRERNANIRLARQLQKLL